MSISPRLIHVVFKTHLDIGFTDLAARVTENYLQVFIPRAIETAAELHRRRRLDRLCPGPVTGRREPAGARKRKGLKRN
jgi:hypothetical protein